MITRSRLRSWHVWLGWIIGIPILLWVVSGLVMVWKPIEEVRGEHLLRETAPLRLDSAAQLPSLSGQSIKSLALEQRAAGARWVITLSDGTTLLADSRTGALLPRLSAADAVREVTSRYSGSAKVGSATRTDPEAPPLELRRPIAAWKVAMDDGTNFYVDSASGAVVARRTGWWRFYDLMWGFHIWDLTGREDMHNPLVIGLAIIALAMSLLALVLLPLTINRRRKAKP